MRPLPVNSQVNGIAFCRFFWYNLVIQMVDSASQTHVKMEEPVTKRKHLMSAAAMKGLKDQPVQVWTVETGSSRSVFIGIYFTEFIIVPLRLKDITS